MATTDNMAAELMAAYGRVLDKVPNFITDEKAQAGQRVYKYLNLGTILKTIKPIFAAEGLHFYQNVTMDTPTSDSRQPVYGRVETIVFNNDSNMTVSSYPFLVSGDPQAVGSNVTYARRYSLYAALGIYPDKDDDGAAAKNYYNSPAPVAGGISRDAAQTLADLARQYGVNLLQLASQLRGRQVSQLRELTPEEGSKLTAIILKGGAQ